ncbi:universal stress protein [Neisseriaceae bacterium CLB008]|nr:universal stress protein [Neisseriaceae bacterium]
MLTSILIAIDGTPDTHALLVLARKLARPETQTHILYVSDAAYTLTLEAVDNSAATTEQGAAVRLLNEVLAAANALGLNAKGHVVGGDPAALIVAQAQNIGASLIVMGHRQLSPLSRLFDPSVCIQVIKTATCPVLIDGFNAHV